MSLQNKPINEVPETTAQIARAAFPMSSFALKCRRSFRQG